MESEQWQRVIDINLTGVWNSCKAEAELMQESGGGSIINIASMSGIIVNRGLDQAHYNCSKAGVIHLSKSPPWSGLIKDPRQRHQPRLYRHADEYPPGDGASDPRV